jgi:uncharacterized membrane protein YfcA
MDSSLIGFILVGFGAQLIDGALGMAYGVSATTVLLSMGVPPKFASASVHAAEIVTTGVSGVSHWLAGNVHFDLAKKLLIPGVIGAVIGAYVLTSVDGDAIKPWISIYLAVMGAIIVWRAFKDVVQNHVRTWLEPLGFVGGFADAIGGGGWGPIVTTTLVARGNPPRFTVGSVNLTEFFVTVAQSAMFLVVLRSSYLTYWRAILGLLIGGALAAPVAALVTKRLPRRAFMVLVGALIIALSLRNLLAAL